MKGKCAKMPVILCEPAHRVLAFHETPDSVGACDYALYDDTAALSMME